MDKICLQIVRFNSYFFHLVDPSDDVKSLKEKLLLDILKIIDLDDLEPSCLELYVRIETPTSTESATAAAHPETEPDYGSSPDFDGFKRLEDDSTFETFADNSELYLTVLIDDVYEAPIKQEFD
ncbi:hypothetical protein AYI68_g917 [Smittium mucronatum]|uniref:Uncharacterized protein n=1 Tax=Smittium mucronatum TaxID=133383 RepID=A0A1R0H743_9FUNG|nr:hypothetical protein AYI68_g917 [Smittium mucronatum]